jgi:hypothetical protein
MSQISDDVYKIRCELKKLVAMQVAFKAVTHEPHVSNAARVAQSQAHYNALLISTLHDLSLVIRGKPTAHRSPESRIENMRNAFLGLPEQRTPEVA